MQTHLQPQVRKSEGKKNHTEKLKYKDTQTHEEIPRHLTLPETHKEDNERRKRNPTLQLYLEVQDGKLSIYTEKKSYTETDILRQRQTHEAMPQYMTQPETHKLDHPSISAAKRFSSERVAETIKRSLTGGDAEQCQTLLKAPVRPAVYSGRGHRDRWD